jgi:hypothetical protein
LNASGLQQRPQTSPPPASPASLLVALQVELCNMAVVGSNVTTAIAPGLQTLLSVLEATSSVNSSDTTHVNLLQLEQFIRAAADLSDVDPSSIPRPAVFISTAVAVSSSTGDVSSSSAGNSPAISIFGIAAASAAAALLILCVILAIFALYLRRRKGRQGLPNTYSSDMFSSASLIAGFNPMHSRVDKEGAPAATGMRPAVGSPGSSASAPATGVLCYTNPVSRSYTAASAIAVSPAAHTIGGGGIGFYVKPSVPGRRPNARRLASVTSGAIRDSTPSLATDAVELRPFKPNPLFKSKMGAGRTMRNSLL